MKKIVVILPVLAALFYALSIPFSKLLVSSIPSTALAGLLYLGAGMGMSVLLGIQTFNEKFIQKDKAVTNYEKITVKDTKYIIAMVLLDVIAPISLLFAVQNSNSSVVSLLNNFEIVATSLIAFLLFKEKISKLLLQSIILITIASILLSVDFTGDFQFSLNSVLVLVACICWGFENNCTKSLSNKNPFIIVIIKGFGSGFTSLLIGLLINDDLNWDIHILYALLLGFVSYGLSVFTYVLSQKYIGASRTSCYYGFAPFIGVALSFILLQEKVNLMFFIALAIMILGVVILTLDTIREQRVNNESKII